MDETDLEVLRNASIGRLVATVAHELNNPVHIVACNAGFLTQYLEGLLELTAEVDAGADAARLAAIRERIEYDYLKQDAPRLIQSMREAAERLADLVRNLRTFSRSPGDLETLDLVEVVDSALVVLAPLFRNRLVVEREVRPPVPAVTGREGHIHQAVLALLAAVAEAVPEGRVKIVVDSDSAAGGRARLIVRAPLTRTVVDEFCRRILATHGAILTESVGADGVVTITLPAER
jgi:two-component system, NtrC family, sensor kinase